MKAFGSRRGNHAEWRFTIQKGKRLKKIHVSKPLNIKSHKSGRRFKLDAEE